MESSSCVELSELNPTGKWVERGLRQLLCGLCRIMWWEEGRSGKGRGLLVLPGVNVCVTREGRESLQGLQCLEKGTVNCVGGPWPCISQATLVGPLRRRVSLTPFTEISHSARVLRV